jgi:hypothetical protein
MVSRRFGEIRNRQLRVHPRGDNVESNELRILVIGLHLKTPGQTLGKGSTPFSLPNPEVMSC